MPDCDNFDLEYYTEDEKDLKDEKHKKIQDLVKDLGDNNVEIREIATDELRILIKEDPGDTVIEGIKELADLEDCEVRARVALLEDIQAEKDTIREKKAYLIKLETRIKNLEGRIKRWKRLIENAEPGTDNGNLVVENISKLNTLINTLNGIRADMEDEKRGLG